MRQKGWKSSTQCFIAKLLSFDWSLKVFFHLIGWLLIAVWWLLHRCVSALKEILFSFISLAKNSVKRLIMRLTDNEIVFTGSYAEFVSHSSSNLRGDPEEDDNVGTEDHDALEDKIKDAVLCAIFASLDLLHETKGSLKNFEELLTVARHIYCKGAGLGEDDEAVKKKWPSDWTAARQILISEGYEDAKKYVICLSDVHPQHWDILESKSDLCCHCGEKGTIPYYYLGFKGKIKCWVLHSDVCYKHKAGMKRKNYRMGSGFQNYHSSGIPIPSIACQCNVSILGVTI